MSSLTLYLQSIGCTKTVYPTSVGRVRTNAPWSPNCTWNGVDTEGTFFQRYGFYNQGIPYNQSPPYPDRYSAGNYVGEALPINPSALDPGVLQKIQQMVGDSSFTPNAQDLMDLAVVRDPSIDDAIYNTRLRS